MAFECPHCHFRNSEIQSAGAIAEKGCTYTCRVVDANDLDRQIVHRAEGEVIVFRTPAATRDALLNGWDDIEMILRHDCDEIDRFEQRQRLDAPWLYTPTPLDGD